MNGTLIMIAIIVFCTLIGYTVGRFIEIATVQHVYSVSTPVTYMHERLKHQSEDDYQATIAADQATISQMANALTNDSAKLKEFKQFSKKYNTQIDYNVFRANVDVGQRINERELVFTGKSSDVDVASNLSKSYAEDAIAIMQKVSNTASINVELSSQQITYDSEIDRKFGVIFMSIGLVIGLLIGLRFWFKDENRKKYYHKMMDQLSGK